MTACGQLNISGHHSAAVVLFRPLEDALDCFAAVTMVEGAAERWSTRKLKPSDAAKAWVAIAGEKLDPDNESLSRYRRALRGQFAHYMHCSYDLCLWDLFFNPSSLDSRSNQLVGTYELNTSGSVINTNAHSIDAHLTAHHLEFIEIVKHAYSRELSHVPHQMRELTRLENEVVEIMERHNDHGCQNVMEPPEIRRSKG
jgi:hypothetical protein